MKVGGYSFVKELAVGEFVMWTFVVTGFPLALTLIQQAAGLLADALCSKTVVHQSAFCERRVNHQSRW
jgi:hypothetical protein